jgi:hypothetical protein
VSRQSSRAKSSRAASSPPAAISSHVGHRQSEAEPRAGIIGGADQQSVKGGSPGSVEGIHPGVRLQSDRRRAMAIVERDPADRWCTGGGDLI